MRLAILGALALALAGCSDPSTTEDPMIPYRATWQKLPDGSSIAQVRIHGSSGDSRSALRCWSDDKKPFTCISVYELDAALGATYVARQFRDELPEMIFPGDGQRDGYGCMRMMGFREEISRGGQALTSNRIEYSSPRWSKSHVQNYLKANGVEGSGYFKCLEILDAMTRGSLATLGTTSVSKDMVL